MPPLMLFRMPLEFIVLELIYFLLIASLCLMIYFKTSEIYKLSKHRGIYFFRNIFLYFSLGYFFRLIHLIVFLSSDMPFRNIRSFNLIFVTYFSTMAILSLIMAVLAKKTKMNNLHLNVLLNVIAVMSALFVFLTKSHVILMVIQIIIFVLAIVISFIKSEKVLSYNYFTYILLFVFWVVNMVTFGKGKVSIPFRFVLYVFSILVFFSIFLRVHKRLKDAKKK